MKSVTKVYSLNINKGIVSAQFLGNLVGKNIVQNKIGPKAIRNSDILIRYQITDDFTPDEISFLESQLVEACKLVRDAIKELKESSRKALEAMTDVFLCYDDNARNTILKKYAEIYEVLLGKMVFKRKAIYKEKGKSLDYVYLSTNADTNTTTIYDKFFERDKYFERIFTRSSWLIHEASHVTGLREEAGSEVFLNAESYRKFICLLFDIATFDELYPEGNIAKTLPLKSNIGRKEFPGPDQPRDSNGQWEKKHNVTFSKTDKHNPSRNFVEDINKGTSIKEGPNKEGINETWAANDIKIDGFEPNSEYTIVLSVKYNYSGIDGDGSKEYNVAYDSRSDTNGNIILERVGFLNSETNGMSEIDAQLKIYTFKGNASENFENIGKVQWTSSKDGMGTYLASHASDDSYNRLGYKNTGNYNGGIIKDFSPKTNPIYEGKLKIK